MEFIIAQIIGAMILLTLITKFQQRTKGKLLLFAIISNILTITQYVLLNASTGATLELVNTVRNMIFYQYEKQKRKHSIVLLVLLSIVIIFAGIVSWHSIFSIIPIIITVIYTYGLWQGKLLVTKVLAVIYSVGMVIYNIAVSAYMGALASTIVGVSIIISIVRYKDDKKNMKIFRLERSKKDFVWVN